MLAISIYGGEYKKISFFTRICEIDGSVVPEGRPPFSPLEEALRVVEMCADKYSMPRCSYGSYLTVFIGRKNGMEVEPLVRLDIFARNGLASAGVVGLPPRWDTEPIQYSPDDDVLAIVRKVLAA